MTEPRPGADAAPAPLASIDALLDAAVEALARGEPAVAAPLVRESRDAIDGLSAGPERSRLTARALRAEGTAARMRGRYADAEEAFDRGLAAAADGFGAASLEVAELHNDLGMTWKYVGRFEDAAAAYERARVTLEALPDADPGDVAALYHNLGGLAHARGDLRAAEPLARRAIELRTEALGADDPETLLDRSAHAAILADLGRTDEAEHAILAILPGLIEGLGDDHPEVAVALNNLAAIEQAHGRIIEAEARYRRVVDIRSARLGPDSPSLAIALSNHATALAELGRPDDARAGFEHALAILDGAVEPDHPTLLAVRANLARLDEQG